MNNDQQPGVPQQPENNGWQQPGQPPYVDPAQGPYGQPGQFGQAPPKGGIPAWGWLAGGVGVAAVLAVAGVMVLGGLGQGNGGAAAPAPTESTLTPESAKPSGGPTADGSPAAASGSDDVYLFQDADFTSPPVWSAKMPAGWTMSGVKGGTITYRSSDNPCIFTTHQAILPPREATVDEKATAATMQGEIEGVKNLAGTPVTVVTDAGSTYTKLRTSAGARIELQEAELRFQNKSNTDLVYRIAVRSMPAGNGLMELNLACPASLPAESDLWTELKDSLTMVDDPAA